MRAFMSEPDHGDIPEPTAFRGDFEDRCALAAEREARAILAVTEAVQPGTWSAPAVGASTCCYCWHVALAEALAAFVDGAK